MNKAFMREAIELSIEKMEAGAGGPFGALVVKNGEVIGRGWNCVTSANDPTAHAEVMAIRDACRKLAAFNLSGCEIYASCEPCPMCLAAIYWARLDKLYFAASREDASDAGFDDAVIYAELSRSGIERMLPAEQGMRNEARQAFEQWKKKAGRKPY